MWLSHRCPGSESRCRSAGMSKPCGRGSRPERAAPGRGCRSPLAVFRKRGKVCPWSRPPRLSAREGRAYLLLVSVAGVGGVGGAGTATSERAPFPRPAPASEERRRVVVVVVVVVVVHVAVALAEQDHSGHDLRAELLGFGFGWSRCWRWQNAAPFGEVGNQTNGEVFQTRLRRRQVRCVGGGVCQPSSAIIK